MRYLAKLNHLCKTYQTHNNHLVALNDISFNVAKGEFVCIMGQSGSGKSTLLNIIGLLDHYEKGNYELNGLLVNEISDNEAAAIRNSLIGFVFQSFHLIHHKNAIDNIALPLLYRGYDRRKRIRKAGKYLDMFGLKEWEKHKPNELSGGQKQRIAIARALVTEPELILADEPTGALDSKTSHEIMEILRDINNDGKTIIMVTHEKEMTKYASRILTLKDGEIESDVYQNQLVYNEIAVN